MCISHRCYLLRSFCLQHVFYCSAKDRERRCYISNIAHEGSVGLFSPEVPPHISIAQWTAPPGDELEHHSYNSVCITVYNVCKSTVKTLSAWCNALQCHQSGFKIAYLTCTTKSPLGLALELWSCVFFDTQEEYKYIPFDCSVDLAETNFKVVCII